MKQQIVRFWREEDGITALEYGILAAVVAVVLISFFGPELKTVFTDIFSKVTTAVSKKIQT